MPGKQVLMVEGNDDEHVVKHICGQRGLGTIGKIQPYGGKDALIDAIGVRLKESDIEALGLILDADTDLHARWQAIADRLNQAGYASVPATPLANGTVVNPPTDSLLPKVGVWLMPDNTVPGILEDFLRFLVPNGDTLIGHVDQAINGLPQPTRFSESKRPKAVIHTWLSWQADPGKPLGLAITARYLDASLPSADHFADWLRRTFFN